MCAASNGQARVVEMLLERDEVNPYMLDNIGRVPLIHAYSNGHAEVVGILLIRYNTDSST